MLKKEMEMRVFTDQAATEKAKIDKLHEDLRTGRRTQKEGGIGFTLSELAAESETATRDLALTSIATQSAKRVQQARLSDALIKNNDVIHGVSLREYAGGIDTDNGADSALAFAVSQKYEAEVKLVNERTQLIKQFKLNGEERQDLAMGRHVVQGKYTIDKQDYFYDFTPDDKLARDAAIDMQLGIGSFADIQEIIENSGGTLKDYIKTISEGIPAKGIPNKAAWTGGAFIDQVLRGNIKDKASMHKEIIDTFIIRGKIKPEMLAMNDAISIATMTAAIASAQRTPLLDAKLVVLKKNIGLILDEKGDMYRSTTDASRDAFRDLDNSI